MDKLILIGGKSNTRILDKYDKNNDGFISIREYLDEETSKGPREKKGLIDYNFSYYDNIFNFFFILIRDVRKFKIACIPKFKLIYKVKNLEYKERTAAAYNIDTHEYFFPKRIKKAIKNCKKQNIRLIFFTFILFSSKDYFTHANMIIIDIKKKTVERFDPHGSKTCFDDLTKKKSDIVDKQITNLFKNKILKLIGLPKFTFLPPSLISPIYGIQTQESDSHGGMCVTIAMMYLHMRILNPDKKQMKIVKYFINMGRKKLKKIILKYAKYIEKKLKKNRKLVNRLNNF